MIWWTSLILKSKSSIQILVVEDEQILVMLIEDMLINIGCESIEAVASIDGALQFLADAQPDFVILDINLNGTLSYPVAALLRSRKIPFVFEMFRYCKSHFALAISMRPLRRHSF